MQIAVLNSSLASLYPAGLANQHRPAGSEPRGECGRLCSECGSCRSLNLLDDTVEPTFPVMTSDLLQD